MQPKFSDSNPDAEPDFTPADVQENAGKTGEKKLFLPPRWTLESRLPSRDASQDFEIRVVEEEPPVEQPEPEPEPVIRLEVQKLPDLRLKSAGEEPLPVVARPLSEMDALVEEPERIYRDGESWGNSKIPPLRWILLIAGLVGLLVITAILLQMKLQWKDEVRGKSFFSGIEVVDQSAKGFAVGDTDLGPNSEAEGRDLFARYAAAKSVDQVLPMIRNATLLEDKIRAAWKPMNVPPGWTPPNRTAWTFRKAGDRDFAFLGGMFPNFTPFTMYFVSENGKLQIDWEASTGFGDSSFADLNAGVGKGGVIRGLISNGNLYTANFPESDFQCFRLKSPDRESLIWLYARRKSEEEEFISKQFRPGAIPGEVFSEFPVTLRLAPPLEGSLKNQWVIREVLHIDWVTP